MVYQTAFSFLGFASVVRHPQLESKHLPCVSPSAIAEVWHNYVAKLHHGSPSGHSIWITLHWHRIGDHIVFIGPECFNEWPHPHRESISYYLLPVASCLINHMPIALLPIAYCLCLLPIAYCHLPIAYCFLPFAFCLLPSSVYYCLSPIAYCLLPIARLLSWFVLDFGKTRQVQICKPARSPIYSSMKHLEDTPNVLKQLGLCTFFRGAQLSSNKTNTICRTLDIIVRGNLFGLSIIAVIWHERQYWIHKQQVQQLGVWFSPNNYCCVCSRRPKDPQPQANCCNSVGSSQSMGMHPYMQYMCVRVQFFQKVRNKPTSPCKNSSLPNPTTPTTQEIITSVPCKISRPVVTLTGFLPVLF